MTAREVEKLKKSYEKFLSEDNCEIEPWNCKVCGWPKEKSATRLHAAASHVLEHLNRGDLNKRSRTRQLEIE